MSRSTLNFVNFLCRMHHFDALTRRQLLTKAKDYNSLNVSGIENMKFVRNRLERHVRKLQNASASSPLFDAAPDHIAYPMKNSFCQALIPLKTDDDLRQQYANWLGKSRFGRLLEDLDTFAVYLAYVHNQGVDANEMRRIDAPPRHRPMLLVTACVDRITLRVPYIENDRDLILEGHVSWVGRSSIESTMQCLQETDDNQWRQVLEAKFVMVGLDPFVDEKPVNHPLLCETAEEIQIYNEGERAKELRKSADQESLLVKAPTEAERNHIHDLFLQTIDVRSHSFRHRQLPSNSEYVWMEDCKLKNVVVCFPEQRNLYHKIFGGFLMRQAFELAFSNAAIFLKGVPQIEAVDDIVFRKSVEIGSMLFLSSEVCYSDGHRIQLRVHAEVVQPAEQDRLTTNTFYFTFSGRKSPHDMTPILSVPKVMPKTYADGMLYLSGKRHFEQTISEFKIKNSFD